MATKFYHCPICGNVITKIVDSNVIPHCCGQEMEELTPHADDSNFNEKHVPVVCNTENGMVRISIGATPHPMTPEHHIQFIYLEYKDKAGHCGGQFIRLTADDAPECDVCTCMVDVETIYEYCNIHGLWMKRCEDLKSNCCCTDHHDDDCKKNDDDKCKYHDDDSKDHGKCKDSNKGAGHESNWNASSHTSPNDDKHHTTTNPQEEYYSCD